ncbi:MAG TPA: amino acid ABC transporter permease [Roseiarcus sp.]|nr:amino acid ABC transporter permease [Roseiarcus sp.]
MAAAAPFVRTAPEPILPAPIFDRGALAWMRENLFSNAWSSLLTIALIALAVWVLPDLVAWATAKAVWAASDGGPCRAHQDGACWAFVGRKFDYFSYGSYPVDQRWRVDATEAAGAVLIAWLLWPRAPRRGLGVFLFFVVYPVAAFVLLRGSRWFGLPIVDTALWGGIFVSLLTALVGIVFSLPLGVLLALGRRSRLPIVKAASVIYIETMRGVPFITVLFMANNMLPLFLPEAWAPDRLLRPLVGTALFAAAYLAEEVRGGLQSIPKSQFEGAMAIGLNYRLMMGLIILPQALTLVIPGIVNNFIGLFKDTTLISAVGTLDFLETVQNAAKDPVWIGPTIAPTGYVFAAIFYFAFCFGMSRYSLAMERRLAAGRRG